MRAHEIDLDKLLKSREGQTCPPEWLPWLLLARKTVEYQHWTSDSKFRISQLQQEIQEEEKRQIQYQEYLQVLYVAMDKIIPGGEGFGDFTGKEEG